jgi:CHAD domain-containing protein
MIGKKHEPHLDENAMTSAPDSEIGITVWMDRVAGELKRVARNFDADAVHDLRVALRRCLSVVDLFIYLEPAPDWKEMRHAGRRLFKRLGDLRDVQVMREWVDRFFPEPDAAAILMVDHLTHQETALRKRARKAIGGFKSKQWAKWKKRMARRHLPALLESDVLLQYAYERWQSAYDLHRQALRNRSQVAFHKLRIGVKRFRYTVENFLPQRHTEWGQDLKTLQDELGDLHDLFMLWQTAREVGALANREVYVKWRLRIDTERRKRLQAYRSVTIGPASVWKKWREGLSPVSERHRQTAR